MNTKEAFAAWLIGARKENGDCYAERTQERYLTAFCRAQERFPFLSDLRSVNPDGLSELKRSEYYFRLSESRRKELDATLALYEEFLQDRENGWQTIAEFSEGKEFACTNEFSLHVTYDEPFTVKELSEFLHEFDVGYKSMLIEQGVSPADARRADMSIARVSEGSIWFDIISLGIQIAMPILDFVFGRFFNKRNKQTGVRRGNKTKTNKNKIDENEIVEKETHVTVSLSETNEKKKIEIDITHVYKK